MLTEIKQRKKSVIEDIGAGGEKESSMVLCQFFFGMIGNEKKMGTPSQNNVRRNCDFRNSSGDVEGNRNDYIIYAHQEENIGNQDARENDRGNRRCRLKN